MSSVPSSTLHAVYEARLAAGELRLDPAQKRAVEILEPFVQSLDGYTPAKRGLWAKITGPRVTIAPLASGLYLYGEVGRGKSMLMDMFFDSAQIVKKRRVHFHQFMLEIHARMHKLQGQADDILPQLARDLAKETWLLCFDEFHVGNIADAMILGRLFTALFEAGVIIVATSNWPPDLLYKNGLQRDRFLPFIELIKQRMIVHCMSGEVDHRYEQTRSVQSYLHPLGEAATRQLQGLFLQLTDDAVPEVIELPVQGRVLKIVHAAKGVGFFNFDELCGQPMGSADFLAIAECLHTVILDEVPLLNTERRNETVRFTTLIDALYEAKVKLFMASEVSPDKICTSGDQAFAFQRTVSRLMEMQGEEYRRKPHLAA